MDSFSCSPLFFLLFQNELLEAPPPPPPPRACDCALIRNCRCHMTAIKNKRKRNLVSCLFIFYGHKLTLFEPRHEIPNNVVFTTSKPSDQPALTCSLMRAFASRLNIL